MSLTLPVELGRSNPPPERPNFFPSVNHDRFDALRNFVAQARKFVIQKFNSGA